LGRPAAGPAACKAPGPAARIIAKYTMRATAKAPDIAGLKLFDITGIMDYWWKVSCELGPERVFFATGMPFYGPAVLVSNMQYAHWIDEPAKRLILGINQARLLDKVGALPTALKAKYKI